jgi:hypothetical protein
MVNYRGKHKKLQVKCFGGGAGAFQEILWPFGAGIFGASARLWQRNIPAAGCD